MLRLDLDLGLGRYRLDDRRDIGLDDRHGDFRRRRDNEADERVRREQDRDWRQTGDDYADRWLPFEVYAPAMSVEEPVVEAHKSVAICYVLLVLAGFFMAHRWYLRRRRSAALYILLVWGGTILGSAFAGQGYVIGGVTAVAAEAIGLGWLFVDLFLIPGMARTTPESAR